MKNKKGTGPVAYMFSIIFFFIFIGVVGGTLWSLFASASDSAGLTGIEAFVYNYFVIIVVFSAILGTLAFYRFGGEG